MAEVEGLRINELIDTQESYDKDVYLQADADSFTNTKKVKMGTVYPLTDTLAAVNVATVNIETELLRTNNGSGAEKKITIFDFLGIAGVVSRLKDVLGLTATAWLAGNRESSRVDAAEFIAQMASKSGFNTITGTIKLNSQAAIDELLFTLHSSMPTCTQRIYFSASDDSPSDENYEMYIQENTRNVKAFTANSSTASRASYCVTYPSI